jgi:hypothetical protein
MQNLHHINVENYGMEEYQDPSRVRNHIRFVAYYRPSLLNFVTRQDLAGPYAYPNSNVGLTQGIHERVQVTFPVRANLPFLCMFSIMGCFTVGGTRKWDFWLCPSGCCTRP